eukprot:scaffold53013_cov47-Phaeocystis_antarctica.AAC.6
MYWSQTESSKWSLGRLSFHPRPPFSHLAPVSRTDAQGWRTSYSSTTKRSELAEIADRYYSLHGQLSSPLIPHSIRPPVCLLAVSPRIPHKELG